MVTILNDFNEKYVTDFHKDVFMDFDKKGKKLFANTLKKSINDLTLRSYSLKGYEFGKK